MITLLMLTVMHLVFFSSISNAVLAKKSLHIQPHQREMQTNENGTFFLNEINVTDNENGNGSNDTYGADDERHRPKKRSNNKDNLSNLPTPTPSSSPSSLQSVGPSLQPSSAPSINCEIGLVYGKESNTTINLTLDYEIAFNSHNFGNSTPPFEYIERVILPYMREVFAQSFFALPPYCGEECLMRRAKLRAVDQPLARHLNGVLSEASRERTPGKKNARSNQIQSNIPNLDINNTTSDETEVEIGVDSSNTVKGSNTTVVDFIDGSDDISAPVFETIDGILGIELGPFYDEVNDSCNGNGLPRSSVRIKGGLVFHVDGSTDLDVLEAQLVRHLSQAMSDNWYICDDEHLDISNVAWLYTDCIEIIEDSSYGNKNLTYGLVGLGVLLLGSLAASLMLVRNQKEPTDTIR